jgi:hypothetical protein
MYGYDGQCIIICTAFSRGMFQESFPYPTHHPRPEHGTPFPKESNLYASTFETLRLVINENDIPTAWIDDLQAPCQTSIEIRATVHATLELPEYAHDTPVSPQGFIPSHWKRQTIPLSRKTCVMQRMRRQQVSGCSCSHK